MILPHNGWRARRLAGCAGIGLLSVRFNQERTNEDTKPKAKWA
jgi:hypothetical protein